MWRHYYERWGSMTIDRLSPEMIGLVPELGRYVPPARIFDKHVYSPWTGTDLHPQLRGDGIDTVIITGGETDVCVLATMLGAIDWGFRVILVTDALCSSADETHDAIDEYLYEPLRQAGRNRHHADAPGQLARKNAGAESVMSAGPSHLVQILLPRRPAADGPSAKSGLTGSSKT
jgi:Isochorismatase family